VRLVAARTGKRIAACISGFQAFAEAMMFAAGSMIAVKSRNVLGISCFEKIGMRSPSKFYT
jgi:hypothetical protein